MTSSAGPCGVSDRLLRVEGGPQRGSSGRADHCRQLGLGSRPDAVHRPERCEQRAGPSRADAGDSQELGREPTSFSPAPVPGHRETVCFVTDSLQEQANRVTGSEL